MFAECGPEAPGGSSPPQPPAPPPRPLGPALRGVAGSLLSAPLAAFRGGDTAGPTQVCPMMLSTQDLTETEGRGTDWEETWWRAEWRKADVCS